MRTFLKLGSLALTASLALTFGCGSDDDDPGSSGSGGSGGDTTTGSGGTGGDTTSTSSSGGTGGDTTTGSGGTGGDTTSSGGTGGTAAGGSAGMPPTSEAPYTNDACLATDGPTAAVTGSATGAFAEEDDWMDGWTNWSTNSSGEDLCSGTLTDFPTTGDRTLTADDSPYALDAAVYVADGEMLEIEPGVVVCASSEGSLIVSRGGMIDAEGTAADPIIFTSGLEEGEKSPGNWGGVIILGNAPTWEVPSLIEGLMDADENHYGGTDEDDDSGTFAYVRIEFGGTELTPGNEINGLTMGAVGSGTDIHHVQVNTTLDDCFEWFGGTVNAHHLICNNAGDDMFDADEGFQGTLSELFGRQHDPLSSDPNGFEMDSHSGGTNTPITTIDAMNVTLCGTGEEELALTYGMVLRENLEGSFSNIYISGFSAGVDVRDDFGSESDPNVTLEDSAMFEGVTHNVAYNEAGSDDNDEGFNERDWFSMGSGNMEYTE